MFPLVYISSTILVERYSRPMNVNHRTFELQGKPKGPISPLNESGPRNLAHAEALVAKRTKLIFNVQPVTAKFPTFSIRLHSATIPPDSRTY